MNDRRWWEGPDPSGSGSRDALAPDRLAREARANTVWLWIGVAAAALGLVGIYGELGRHEVCRLGVCVGGPDPQAMFVCALITVAGAVFAWRAGVRRTWYREHGGRPTGRRDPFSS